MVAAALFALTVWIRAEPGFADWVDILEIHAYYIGIYILIGMSIIVMVSSFLGCCSALMEHSLALFMVGFLNSLECLNLINSSWNISVYRYTMLLLHCGHYWCCCSSEFQYNRLKCSAHDLRHYHPPHYGLFSSSTICWYLEDDSRICKS